MRKIFNFGKIDFYGTGRKINKVTIEVNLRDTDKGPEFSASGDVWNSKHTDIVCGGQCLDELDEFAALHDNPLFSKIYRLWKLYHLNGMNAGTVRQTKAVNDYLERTNSRYDYSQMCDYLKSIDLYEDKEYLFKYGNELKPYRYGSSWLYRSIPDEDLKIIKELLED